MLTKAMTEDYGLYLQDLLPQGNAWSRDPNTVLSKLLFSLATEFASTHNEAISAIDEAIPSTTSNLLVEWEKVAGLPDGCVGEAGSYQERINQLVQKITSRGGQSIAFYKDVAALLGYSIEIVEFKPFRAGINAVGDSLTNGDWQFYWAVEVLGNTLVTTFAAGSSSAGDPLASWGNELLECVIQRLKPTHTQIQFNYYTN